jgi:hypothetical protein
LWPYSAQKAPAPGAIDHPSYPGISSDRTIDTLPTSKMPD